MTSALNATQVADELGWGRKKVARLTKAGKLPVWFYDDDTGRPVYHRDVLEAHRRRTGELLAERGVA